MARKDKPYLQLYVQDFLTDENLRECSAASTGVFIFMMCVLHKQEEYGKILLKQRDKQSDKQTKNFALKFGRHLPYSVDVIENAIDQLIDLEVIKIDGDYLYQKRMVSDSLLSEKRAEAGSKGGKKTIGRKNEFAQEFAQAKIKATSDIDIDNEIDIDSDNSFEKSEKLFLTGNVNLMGFKGQCRVWMENEKEYLWAKADEYAIDDIERKIFEMHRRSGQGNTKEDLVSTFKYLIDNLPEWIRVNKFSLDYINLKFNEVINGIKNQSSSAHRKKGSAPISREDAKRLEELLESGALLGVD